MHLDCAFNDEGGLFTTLTGVLRWWWQALSNGCQVRVEPVVGGCFEEPWRLPVLDVSWDDEVFGQLN